MLDGNYKVYSSCAPLADLAFLQESKSEKAYSGMDVTVRFITPPIKTEKGFFQLALKKEVIKNTDEKCSGVAFFTVVKIANADGSSVDDIRLLDRVQRFEIKNFDSPK